MSHRATLLPSCLLLLPSPALALGGPVAEPNWKLWFAGSFLGLLAALILATIAYRYWLLPSLHPALALYLGYFSLLSVLAAGSLLAYVFWVGPAPDVVAYAVAAAWALILVVGLAARRRTI